MNAATKPKMGETNASYCKFGFERLLKLLTALENQIDGVIKGDDIEYVHKMRVASRRIRAALPIFRLCFPRKKFKKWLREVKNITCLLGEARDLDVQIAFIEQYMSKLEFSTDKSGLDLMLESHKDRRDRVQPSLVRGLEELTESCVLEDMREFCEQKVEALSDSSSGVLLLKEKAHWYISCRLDDFLAMEDCVYLENELLKHHEMRIRAKKLRYTMESFAPLYEDKLTQEIETMKAFQDSLGEMHDCDVWIAYIPEFIHDGIKPKSNSRAKKNTDPQEVKQALLKFLADIKEQRQSHYLQFVRLWEENKQKDFFDKLRKITDAGLSATEETTKQVLINPQAKIAVLSDIHANLQALERVFEDAEKRGVDVFLNAGDAVGFGASPNEVVGLLHERNVLGVVGNYDLEVVEGKAKAKGEKQLALDFTRKEMSKSCANYLFALPHEVRLEVDGTTLLVTHGSPESIDEHIYHNTPAKRLKTIAASANADVVVVGHSHEQFRRTANGVCVVNPGSVGRPGDGNSQAAYALLRFRPFKVELVRLDYDVAAAADALRRKGLPESFAQMLLRGVSLDAIAEEDQAKQNEMEQNCKETVKASEEVSKSYWQETDHFTQVTTLALAFFDQLRSLHGLGKRERCWLECAAVLHDIGLSQGSGGHNKKSAHLILNETQLPFTSKERRIIASIARYHRRALPKKSHWNLAALSRQTIQKVKVLSSFLRVADALDYTHQSIVESINVKVGTKQILVQCVSQVDAVLEEESFNKKKDLFEKTFAKKLVLVWTKR
ncbi:MAG: YfcE family phosphodiesterase [Candidatus Bathyarchaeota archaeon]|nr:YfcE family phosphodiesterase [Candidatus Bathyarchaeota archaeon]